MWAFESCSGQVKVVLPCIKLSMTTWDIGVEEDTGRGRQARQISLLESEFHCHTDGEVDDRVKIY